MTNDQQCEATRLVMDEQKPPMPVGAERCILEPHKEGIKHQWLSDVTTFAK